MQRAFLTLVAGLLVTNVAAAETASDPTAVVDRARTERLRVAVVDLAANGVKADLANTMTGILADELNRLHVFSVISNQDIRAMMTHDALQQLAGCDGARCSSNIPNALGAQYLVSGSIGNIGKRYTLTFVLTDVTKGTVEGRASATVDDPVKLLDAATRSSQVLVSKVLASKQSTLLVTCSERGATVKIDGEIVGTTPLPKRSITWGPHLVEIEKAGFVTGQEDVTVQGNGMLDRHFQLTPSQDYLNLYESKARKMRIGAWVATGTAAAAFAGAVYFQFDHIRLSNQFVSQRTQYEANSNPTQQQYDSLSSLHNSAVSAIDRTYILAGVGAVLTAGALYFWIAGDDPGKYSAYRETQSGDQQTAPPATKPVAFHLLDKGALASLSW